MALTGLPVTVEMTNRFVPTGGVLRPIIRFTITMIAKWIGSIPNETAVGCRIGTKIRIAGTVSTSAPTMSRKRLTIRRKMIGLSVIDENSTCAAVGMSSSARNQANMVDVATT